MSGSLKTTFLSCRYAIVFRAGCLHQMCLLLIHVAPSAPFNLAHPVIGLNSNQVTWSMVLFSEGCLYTYGWCIATLCNTKGAFTLRTVPYVAVLMFPQISRRARFLRYFCHGPIPNLWKGSKNLQIWPLDSHKWDNVTKRGAATAEHCLLWA